MTRIACFNRWTMALLAALVAVGMWFGSAYAAPAGGAGAAKGNPALSHMYRDEQQRLKIQDARLQRAVEYAAKIDAVIARLAARGKDTAALEQAVAAFRAGIAQARAEWQAASDILAAHAGFDAAGKVSNADQARATLRDAHGHMEQAHTIARGAYTSLHEALVAYRKAHREVKELVAPEQP